MTKGKGGVKRGVGRVGRVGQGVEDRRLPDPHSLGRVIPKYTSIMLPFTYPATACSQALQCSWRMPCPPKIKSR